MLCGDRAALGDKWPELVESVRAALAANMARVVADDGRMLAIENHQDFGSDELVGFCEATRGVGICVDAGNTFPVAEAPLDFYARVAPHVRHVHLKDYRVQFTDEGYRLVRCAIGDGAVPIAEMLDLFAAHHREADGGAGAGRAGGAACAAVLTPEWWRVYPPKAAPRSRALPRGGARQPSARGRRLSARRGRTGDDGALVDYELAMIRRSAANMRALGLVNEGETA